MVAFCSTVQNSSDCFVLEVLTVNNVSRFQNRICIVSQEKKNKILYIANKELGAATFDSQ